MCIFILTLNVPKSATLDCAPPPLQIPPTELSNGAVDLETL